LSGTALKNMPLRDRRKRHKTQNAKREAAAFLNFAFCVLRLSRLRRFASKTIRFLN
jgi:hypothetical protein